jgi:hypothetical protein
MSFPNSFDFSFSKTTPMMYDDEYIFLAQLLRQMNEKQQMMLNMTHLMIDTVRSFQNDITNVSRLVEKLKQNRALTKLMNSRNCW